MELPLVGFNMTTSGTFCMKRKWLDLRIYVPQTKAVELLQMKYVQWQEHNIFLFHAQYFKKFYASIYQQVSTLTKLKAGGIHTPSKYGLSIGSALSFPSWSRDSSLLPQLLPQSLQE